MDFKPVRQLTAVTIGGAMVDTIAVVDDALIERISLSNAGRAFLLLEQGMKTEASNISTHCGGGAINAAVALSRLGYSVRPVVKTGIDDRAVTVRSALAANGIDAGGVITTDAAPTGASAIISAHDRNAAVFTFRGANTTLSRSDLAGQDLNVDLLYIAPLSGDSADALADIVNLTDPARTIIIANLGQRQIASRFDVVRRLLPRLDVLAVNRSEAEALARQAITELAGAENADVRRMAARGLEDVSVTARSNGDAGSAALIEAMHRLGARRVLLTDGKRGAFLGSAGEIVHCAALETAVISTVGAGDAFVATFAGILALTDDRAQALRAAAANAASVVRSIDTQSGLLTREALEAAIAEAGDAARIRPVRKVAAAV